MEGLCKGLHAIHKPSAWMRKRCTGASAHKQATRVHRHSRKHSSDEPRSSHSAQNRALLAWGADSVGPWLRLGGMYPPAPPQIAPLGPPHPRGALEGKGPQRRPQKQLGRRLEEVAKAVGGGYCRF